MRSYTAENEAPIFNALNAEFIAKGIKVKLLMERKSPSDKEFVRRSNAVGDRARKEFLAAYKEKHQQEHGTEPVAQIIPLQRDDKGRFQKRR